MNSFYSIIYIKFAELQVSEIDSARFAYPISDLQPFLKTGKNISDCVVGIPPIRAARNAISYGPFVFDDAEFGQVAAVKLLIASITLLSAKSIYRWVYNDFFREWLAKKTDPLRARYVMNAVLDTLARQRIRQIQGKAFYNDVTRTADALSILLLERRSNDYPIMAQAALASFTLGIPVYLPGPVMNIAQRFLSVLRTFESNASKITALIDDHILRDITTAKITKNSTGWEELASTSDSLYAAVAKIPGKWHNMYLPYSHPLSNKDPGSLPIFHSNLITAEEFKKLQPSVKNLKIHNDSLWQESYFEFVRETKFREKIMQKLIQATRHVNFNDVMFPVCDYVGFSKLHAELSPDIRKTSDRARMVKNAFDENTFQEVGSIDLQLAIQSIASQSKRNDIFTKDEELLKDESWMILIDSSQSLGGSVNDLRAVSICLAETAHSILGSNPWGMFAFSDELYCLKDFTERYDNQIKGRIGGLKVGGLSHIPDAIRACSNLVKAHSKDRNFMILVSDGVPSGYSNVEGEFGVAVKELRAHGIALIAIGIGSRSIKKTVRNARIIERPQDIAKEFTELYMSLSN
ncbi:MAG: VWA domain-containing protein [Nitrososphaera sp.]|nr:VWA domain-containing protein [Nitrososphaera sp.]